MAICTLLAASPALGQIVPDAGSTLRQLEPPTLTLPRKPPPEAEIETPSRPVLEAAPDIRFALGGFRIAGATTFSETELLGLVQDFVGEEVGIAELGEAVGRITRYYAERGYPLAAAYLPAQDVEGGIVEIIVLEGRVGKVDLVNRTRVRDGAIANYLAPLPGRTIEQDVLERQLLFTYDLPGVLPDRAVLSPGQEVGESDLRLELLPDDFVTGSVDLNNHGNYYTGATLLAGELRLASPARRGDVLSANATKGEDLESVGARYELPIGGRGVRTAIGYTHLHYRLGRAFEVLDASGNASSATASVQYPFIRGRQLNLYGGLSYENRSLEDRIGVADIDRTADFAQLSLTGDAFDSLGGSGATAYALRYGQGRLDIESPAALAIDQLTLATDGSYDKWNATFVRLQGITDRLSAYVAVYGQKAGGNLDSSEKMILGGVYGVRAYPQGEAAGDSAVLLTAELRYSFGPLQAGGSLQGAVFVDTGEAKLVEDPFAAIENRRRLRGGGVSLDWIGANGFVVRASIASRIGSAPATAGTDDDTRGWLQAMKRF